MMQIKIFNGTVLATIESQVNAFLATKQYSVIFRIDSQAFLRGALTNYVYTIYYLA